MASADDAATDASSRIARRPARIWRVNSSSATGLRTESPRGVPAIAPVGGIGITIGAPVARDTRYTPWLSPNGIGDRGRAALEEQHHLVAWLEHGRANEDAPIAADAPAGHAEHQLPRRLRPSAATAPSPSRRLSIDAAAPTSSPRTSMTRACTISCDSVTIWVKSAGQQHRRRQLHAVRAGRATSRHQHTVAKSSIHDSTHHPPRRFADSEHRVSGTSDAPGPPSRCGTSRSASRAAACRCGSSQQADRLVGHPLRRELILHQFRDDAAAGDEIGHRDVVDADNPLRQLVGQP